MKIKIYLVFKFFELYFHYFKQYSYIFIKFKLDKFF